MTSAIVGLVLVISIVALSLVLRSGFGAISRGVERCSDALAVLSEQLQAASSRESPGGSPELLERLESVERRTGLALKDLNTQLARLGQRARQLQEAEGEQLPDQEQLELAEQLKAQRGAPPAPQVDNGQRPRLARRR